MDHNMQHDIDPAQMQVNAAANAAAEGPSMMAFLNTLVMGNGRQDTERLHPEQFTAGASFALWRTRALIYFRAIGVEGVIVRDEHDQKFIERRSDQSALPQSVHVRAGMREGKLTSQRGYEKATFCNGQGPPPLLIRGSPLGLLGPLLRGQSGDEHAGTPEIATRAYNALFSLLGPTVWNGLTIQPSPHAMWTELEASYLPTIDDFYQAKHPEFVCDRIFHLGQSPQEHILAWQASANESALYGYSSSGVFLFYDFLNSVNEALPTLLQAYRGLPLYPHSQQRHCNVLRAPSLCHC